MRVLVGTSGWSYKEWKGSFYPAKLPQADMLSFYASRFTTVEVNNSFYRMPSDKVLADWAGQVPSNFRFVVKASRRVTHNRRLADTDGSLEYFLRAVTSLGERLGPTLFQLPPTFKKDTARLRDFLARLPRRWRAALEFRHRSWFDDEVYDLLRSRDVPFVVVDQDESEGAGAPLIATATWGYLRLRRSSYAHPDLQRWADRIRRSEWTEVFVFLKHEDGSPQGPGTAEEFKEIITIPNR
jgi:uncharacterized protein YecE (DUF72 family)